MEITVRINGTAIKSGEPVTYLVSQEGDLVTIEKDGRSGVVVNRVELEKALDLLEGQNA